MEMQGTQWSKKTTASSWLSPGGRVRATPLWRALGAFTWRRALRPDLPQQIHQPDSDGWYHDEMHEHPP